MLALAQGRAARQLTDFEKQLGKDIEALVFVRIPQIPSSRAYGLSPVASFSEYLTQAPEDQSKWKIVPTEPRPFPNSLRESPAVTEKVSPVPLPVALLTLVLVSGLGWGTVAVARRRKRSALRNAQQNSTKVKVEEIA